MACIHSEGQSCAKYSADAKARSQNIKKILNLDRRILLGEIDGGKLLRNLGLQKIAGVRHLKNPIPEFSSPEAQNEHEPSDQRDVWCHIRTAEKVISEKNRSEKCMKLPKS
jgi:hypothetical protein